MTIRTQSLEDFLPHRAPMLLLSEIIACDIGAAEAKVVISPISAFYSSEHEGVPIWVGVEYMAQTVGLWNGARKKMQGGSVGIAFLLGVRDYQVQMDASDISAPEYFSKGAELHISAVPLFYDEETMVGVFDCTIQASSFKITARMNAISPENPLELIKEIK